MKQNQAPVIQLFNRKCWRDLLFFSPNPLLSGRYLPKEIARDIFAVSPELSKYGKDLFDESEEKENEEGKISIPVQE
jgi:hypothetical protein